MDVLLAALAGLAAAGFLADLARSYLARPRPHVAAWMAAILMYGGATGALFIGLAVGWNPFVFKTFYFFGAIVNVPFLALGAAYLVLGRRVGWWLLWAFLALAAIAAVATARASFVMPLPEEGLPSGREVFQFLGPRIWAVIGNVVGSVLLVGLALYSAFRFRRENPRLVAGNLLIVAGVVVQAATGTVTAFFGEAGSFALALLLTVILLWIGYRVATSARARPVTWSE